MSHVVAEARLAEPAGPGLDEGPERRIAGGRPVGAERQRRAHGQRAVVVRLLVDAQQFVRDAVAFEDAGGAEAVIGLGRLRQRAQPVGVREARGVAEPDHLRDRRQFLFDEDAGRIAVAVLLDGQRRHRRDGVAGDAGALERLGVGAGHERQRAAPVAPDRADVDRIVRRGGVELLPRRPALLGEDVGHVEVIGRIADRHGDDPLARLLAAGELGDAVLDVLDRAHPAERREDVAQRLAVHVGVAVDQARHDGAALEIEHARGGRGVRGHRGIGADRKDLVAGNGDRLGDRGAGVDGDDLGVLQDEVGRPCGGGLRGGGQTQSRCQGLRWRLCSLRL